MSATAAFLAASSFGPLRVDSCDPSIPLTPRCAREILGCRNPLGKLPRPSSRLLLP